MKKTLDIKCWKCEQVFTATVLIATGEAPDNWVEVVKPCPYCEAENLLTLREDEIPTVDLYRGAKRGAASTDSGATVPSGEKILEGKAPDE